MRLPTDAPPDRALAEALDAVLAPKPDIDAHACTRALALLCEFRDAATDDGKRRHANRLISLVMAVKHPLGHPPWDAVEAARDASPFRDA